jgi:GH24 family phage-related lysozyme (muramidase)
MPDATDLSLTQSELDEVRGYREGLEWFLGESAPDTAEPVGAPSATPISAAAFDLIVEFEVSSEAIYTQQYRNPTWPGGSSGVTIGIGYDVGYASKPELRGDWQGAIPDPMITALETALRVTGTPAQAVAQRLTSVDVPWGAAISVHKNKVIPRWVGLVERSLPNTSAIGPDCLGALVSLTYNRGASFNMAGDRYAEMRSIKAHMEANQFEQIPTDIRSMERLWPTVRGLRKRREREASLFEQGLRNLPAT